MTVHDDKISSKRRRLFKALSAVPVVATLRPGEVLATNSAYQCATNMPAPSHQYPKRAYLTETPPSCHLGDDCYVYQEREYWSSHGKLKNGGHGVPEDYIVFTESKYITLTDSLDLSGYYSMRLRTRNGVPQMKIKTASGDDCTRWMPTKKGWFLVVGKLNDQHDHFTYHGVYPKHKVLGTGKLGITGTCLGSIPHNVVGAYTVSKG